MHIPRPTQELHSSCHQQSQCHGLLAPAIDYPARKRKSTCSFPQLSMSRRPIRTCGTFITHTRTQTHLQRLQRRLQVVAVVRLNPVPLAQRIQLPKQEAQVLPVRTQRVRLARVHDREPSGASRGVGDGHKVGKGDAWGCREAGGGGGGGGAGLGWSGGFGGDVVDAAAAEDDLR